MIVDERTRRLVHEWAASAAGPDVADALMAMLPPFSTEELATGADLERMTAGLRGEMVTLSARIDGLLPRQLLADVPLAFAVAGLVLAAAKLA
jgi:hypothetical protein